MMGEYICGARALSSAVVFIKKIQERKQIMKNIKLPYEDAELEVVFFSAEDIIVTSGDLGNVDGDGWDGTWN